MSESALRLLVDARRALKQGAPAIATRQHQRFAEMVAFARESSPYYRELYRDLPNRVEDAAQLPVTSKKELMPRFDDWVTDRAVTIGPVRAFLEDTTRIGESFAGKYTVLMTSGTTGVPGLFVLDDRSMAVTSALAFRMLGAWLSVRDVIRIVAGGARMAMINATGGHFASAVAGVRLRRRRGDRVAVFPVRMPLAEMVGGLNRFRPALLAPYASMGALLASEQEAGRLRIRPVLVVLSAEGLALTDQDRIAKAFDAKVRDSYAATECPFLSYRCEHGWLHVNRDWVVLEPVDADHRPTAPGKRSHTVLISNLANRIQPILRYDLGDSVLQRADACPCGNPLPAIQVQGRSADLLTMRSRTGEGVTIAPLAFAAMVDRVRGVDLFQVVQTSATDLRLRARPAAGADGERVQQALRLELQQLLADQGLDNVRVEIGDEPPEQSTGGKYRQVVPLSAEVGQRE